MTPTHTVAACVLLAMTLGCGGSAPPTAVDQTTTPQPAGSQTAAATNSPPAGTPSAQADEPLPPETSPYDALPAETRAVMDTPFTGDFDAMVKRRLIRAGVVYNRTMYFIDKGVQRGLSYESIRLFEEQVNKMSIITGTPKTVIPKVKHVLEYLRPGSIFFWDGDGAMTHDDSMRSLRLMGEEVIPAVREIGKSLDLQSPFEMDPKTNKPVEAAP